jgi:hypothetical protein
VGGDDYLPLYGGEAVAAEVAVDVLHDPDHQRVRG